LTLRGAATMLRRDFEGSFHTSAGGGDGNAMSNPRDADDPQNDGAKPGSKFSDLGARIARARNDRPAQAAAERMRQGEMTGLGRAYRLGAEFVAAILVGLGIGWGIDQVFNTSPWGLIILLLLGFAAGVLNVIRATAEMNAAPTPDMPVVKDDDDE
jgi:ATP synthase protein I